MITDLATLDIADRRFLRDFLPDEEGAAWMPITEWHLFAMIAALLPLRWHAEQVHPDWYVGSEMAIYFPVSGGRSFVAPDLFVATAPPRPANPRRSFDVALDGGFPAFVLEIVSPESQERDTGEKARLYGLLGAAEYAVFDPEGRLRPALQGHRRDGRGRWAAWAAGRRGELRSRVLGLTLVAAGQLLRLEDADGNRLLTAEQERARAEQEHLQAQQERARADQEQARADQERSRADQEQARAEAAEAQLAALRTLLDRLQPPG